MRASLGSTLLMNISSVRNLWCINDIEMGRQEKDVRKFPERLEATLLLNGGSGPRSLCQMALLVLSAFSYRYNYGSGEGGY